MTPQERENRIKKHNMLQELLLAGDKEVRSHYLDGENPVIKSFISRGDKVDDDVIYFLHNDELLEKIRTRAAMDDVAKLAENDAGAKWYEIISSSLDNLAEYPENDADRDTKQEKLIHGIVSCFLNGISADDCLALLSEERLRDVGMFLEEVSRRTGDASVGEGNGDAGLETSSKESGADVCGGKPHGEESSQADPEEGLDKLEDAFRLVNEGKKAECVLRMGLDDAKRKLMAQRKAADFERRKCNEYARKYNDLLKENEELRKSLEAAERNVTRLSVIDEEYERQKSAIDKELESTLNEIKGMVDKVASEDSGKKSENGGSMDDAFGVMSYSNNKFLGYINKLRDLDREMRDGSAEAVSDALNALGCEQAEGVGQACPAEHKEGEAVRQVANGESCPISDESPYSSLEEMLDDLYSLDDDSWIRDAHMTKLDELPDGIFLNDVEDMDGLYGEGEEGCPAGDGDFANGALCEEGDEKEDSGTHIQEGGALAAGGEGGVGDSPSVADPAHAEGGMGGHGGFSDANGAISETEKDGTRAGAGSAQGLDGLDESEDGKGGEYLRMDGPSSPISNEHHGASTDDNPDEKTDDPTVTCLGEEPIRQADPEIKEEPLRIGPVRSPSAPMGESSGLGGEPSVPNDEGAKEGSPETLEKEPDIIPEEVAPETPSEDVGKVLELFDEMPEQGTFTNDSAENPDKDLDGNGDAGKFGLDAEPGKARFEVVGKEINPANTEAVKATSKLVYENVIAPYGVKSFSMMDANSQKCLIVMESMEMGLDDEGMDALNDALDSCEDADARLKLLELVSEKPMIEEIRGFAERQDAEVRGE